MEINGKTVKQYLSTGKIAKIFNVAPRTVAKWIDNGHLKGTKIPGSKHRRVAMSEILRFARVNEIPLFEDEEPVAASLPTVFGPVFANGVEVTDMMFSS